ncbi:MAG: dihydrolipoamide acetyltransferase family protein [Thermoproteota archaeon]|jgi:pyruvate dehydrogenase E2 component (dihydrolipoamide acetyltransferase)|nr:dihydrolipoamide acetyltransferase family protein [Thermoproteota archaeon]
MPKEILLPDIGEGVSEGEIVKWLVKEGDYVKMFQPIVEVLTVKVKVEIPSPYNGKIVKILAKEKEVVRVGKPIALIETEEVIPETKPKEEAKPKEELRQVEIPKEVAEEKKEILATPAVRRLARELGVDLSKVKGTGPGGRILEEDVRRYAEEMKKHEVKPVEVKAEKAALEERIPITGVRRMIAEKLSKTVKTAVLVTHMDECDVTELVKIREELKQEAEKRGVKLTFLPFIIKAVIKALQTYPSFNASVDEEKNELVIKKYYNIGIATATDQGLIVPVIKEADKKGLFELAKEIEELTEKARKGTLKIEEVIGSTFSITNVGPIGGVFATPILNNPDVAILGIGKIKKRPWVVENRIEIRDILTLFLSFDHRVIDGAQAAQFMNEVMKYLEKPYLLLI